MNKKILFIVPMVALVLAGCNKRGEETSTGTNPTSGATDTSATTTGTSTGGSATSATTGGTSTGGTSTTGSSTTGTSTTQTVIPVTGVWVDELSMTLKVDESKQISAHVNPENATDQGLVFTSKNEDVVTVSATGLVTAKGVGSTIVTVSAHADATKSKDVNITVNNLTIPATTNDGFTLLTDKTTLSDEDELYFFGTYENRMFSMNTYTSGNNILANEATINGNIVTPGVDAGVYTLEQGTGGFYIKDINGKYLQVTSEKNYLKAVTTKDNRCLFDVNCADGGTDFVVKVSDTENRHIRFNIDYREDGGEKIIHPKFSAYDDKSSVIQVPNVYVKHAVKKELQSIAVSGQKTEYLQGDTFVKPTVMATFSSGDPEDVTEEAVFTGYDLSKTGLQTVEVSYTYKGVTKTTSYGITVSADTLNSITINGDMTKKEYNLNDAWDPSGLSFVGHYTSGDKPITPELSYNPATANSTELTQVEVTATLSGVSESKTITGISVVSKSSMQIAYEAVEALSSGGVTSKAYEFTGVVIGIQGNTFFVQDGDYGMMIYGGSTLYATNSDIGKNVTVNATLQNYSGCFETKTINKVTLGEVGVMPTAVEVSTSAAFSALKQNILVDFVGFTAEKNYAWTDLTKDYTMTPITKDGTLNIFGSKYLKVQALADQINALKTNDEFSVISGVHAVNKNAHQVALIGTSSVEVKADPVTDVAIKTPMRTEYVAGQYLDPSDLVITVSHESGATEDVAYEGHESDFEFDPSLITVLTTEHTELVITYKGIELDPVTLTVVEKTIVSATIKTQPSKLEYNEGEIFDPSGLVLTVTYDDESTDEVVYTSLDEGFEFDPNLQTPLDVTMNSVAVTYVEVDAGTVAITVNSRPQVSYTRVSSELSDWSGTYLLAYDVDDSNAKLWTGVDTVNCFVDATTDNGVISEVPSGAVTLTIAPMTGGYSVMVNGGDNDGKFIYGKNNDNKLLFGDTGQLNTLSYDDAGDGVLIISNTSVMRYNTTSGQNRFRYIKASTYTAQKIVQLYKLG